MLLQAFYLSVIMSVVLSFYHSFNPSIHRSVILSFYIVLFIIPSIQWTVPPSIYPYIVLSFYLLLHPSVRPSVRPSVHPSLCLMTGKCGTFAGKFSRSYFREWNRSKKYKFKINLTLTQFFSSHCYTEDRIALCKCMMCLYSGVWISLI